MLTTRMRSLREKSGMSQGELALKLNVARTTYSGYENGIREPDFDFIIKVADFHNVSMDYLFGRDFKRSELSALIEELPRHKAVALETFVKALLS
jgi:transcriptional regulator with XRE-family HTH domain